VVAQAPELLGGFVGLPDAWQEVAAEQVGQDAGIDLVRFDLGRGDGLGLLWIGDHHFGHAGFEEADDGPGVGGGFQSDAVVGGQELPGEGE
jgi:hypothetical protein